MKPFTLGLALGLLAGTAMADQIATLPDGTEVLLHDDRTWEFLIHTPPPDPFPIQSLCHRYASRAVDQQEVNQRAACGLTGDPWNPSWDAHFNWCMTQPPELPAQGTIDREQALLRCTDQRLDCRRYAEMGLEHAQQNTILGCGNTGEAWHGDVNAHYAWCMDQTEDRILAETTVRERALATCAAQRRH